jgi:hypothetical protein
MAVAALFYFFVIRWLGIKEYHEVVEGLKRRFLGRNGGSTALTD